jgi:hypothetical protein
LPTSEFQSATGPHLGARRQDRWGIVGGFIHPMGT